MKGRRGADIRNGQTCREFLLVYLSLTDDSCWEAKSQWMEKMLWGMAVLHLIPYNQRSHKKSYMKSTGGRLRGREISGVG